MAIRFKGDFLAGVSLSGGDTTIIFRRRIMKQTVENAIKSKSKPKAKS